MTMVAGQLRHYVTIQRNAYATNEYGERINAPYQWSQTWARVEALSGRESQYAQTFAPTVSHKITLRYLAGLLPTDEVIWDGREFAIEAVTDPEERKREHVLYATEKVNVGSQTVAPPVPFDSLTSGQFDGLQ